MFKSRLVKPESGNKYYITKQSGGYNPCIKGNPIDKDCDVLSNCVGYAVGRFNEIVGNEKCGYLASTNAENFVDIAKKQGLEVGQNPRLGAIACWAKGKVRVSNDGAGHVAVVETIYADGSIITSESGYKASKPFWTQKRNNNNKNWGQGAAYTFLGFIYNPSVDNIEGGTMVSTMRKGSKGNDVSSLQKKLQSIGYYFGNIDGDFGMKTYEAVVTYQHDKRLQVDGVVGANTRKSLGI